MTKQRIIVVLKDWKTWAAGFTSAVFASFSDHIAWKFVLLFVGSIAFWTTCWFIEHQTDKRAK